MESNSPDTYHKQEMVGQQGKQGKKNTDKEETNGGKAKRIPQYGTQAHHCPINVSTAKVSDKAKPAKWSQETGEIRKMDAEKETSFMDEASCLEMDRSGTRTQQNWRAMKFHLFGWDPVEGKVVGEETERSLERDQYARAGTVV